MSTDTTNVDSECGSIDVKQAIVSATGFLQEAFADESVSSIRLEEVEFDDRTNQWLITLSFLRPLAAEEIPAHQRAIETVVGKQYRREYKSVCVDGQSGEAESIKMRSDV